KHEFVLTHCWNIDEQCKGMLSASEFTYYLQERQKAVEIKMLLQQFKDKQIKVPECILAVKWAWAIVALIHTGELYGFIVLSHPRTHLELNWEILDLLHTASMQAAIYLREQKISEELAQSKQFEGFN